MVLQGLAWRPRRPRARAALRHRACRRHAVYGAIPRPRVHALRVDDRTRICHALPGARAASRQVHRCASTRRSEGLRRSTPWRRTSVVTGRTRDYGLVRLAHEWCPGTLQPRGQGHPEGGTASRRVREGLRARLDLARESAKRRRSRKAGSSRAASPAPRARLQLVSAAAVRDPRRSGKGAARMPGARAVARVRAHAAGRPALRQA